MSTTRATGRADAVTDALATLADTLAVPAAAATVVVINDPPVLSEDAAAAYLGVSARTFRRLRAEGTLPTTRIGSRIVVRRSDLDRFIAELPDERDTATAQPLRPVS